MMEGSGQRIENYRRHAWRKTHKVTWGHAVNGWNQLDEAIVQGYAMFEADIMMKCIDDGSSNNPQQQSSINHKYPVMAHPPDIPVDAMSFTDWLDDVIAHYHSLQIQWEQQQEREKTATKKEREEEKEAVFGIKLDFKDPDAVEPCLRHLHKKAMEDKLFVRDEEEEEEEGFASLQVWLNADILQGPGGMAPKFHASSFIQLCRQYFPGAVMSVGWTTGMWMSERQRVKGRES